MQCAFNQFVPEVKIRQTNSRPWYNVELKKLGNRGNKEFKKRNNGLPNNYDEVRIAFDKLNGKLYECHNRNLSRNIKSDPKKFWTYVRQQRARKI